MENFKEYSFKRYDSSGVFFTDIQKQIDYSLKYDIYDGEELCGTIINSEYETFATFRNAITIKRWAHAMPFERSTYKYKNEIGEPFATIECKYPVFGKSSVFASIEDYGSVYQIKYADFVDLNVASFDYAFDFIREGIKVAVAVCNVFGRPFRADTRKDMAGRLFVDPSLEKEHILVLLLMLQIKMDKDESD